MFLVICILSAALLLPSSECAAIRYTYLLESPYYHRNDRGAKISDGYLHLVLDIKDLGDQAYV